MRDGAGIPAAAEADVVGVSPRVPLIVTFAAERLIDDLAPLADATFALQRAALLAYLQRDPSTLPIALDGERAVASTPAFAEARADRLIARFATAIPPASLADSPVVRFARPAAAVAIRWSLADPALVRRRLLVPVDLFSAASAHAAANGLGSIVGRRSMTDFDVPGRKRVTALCTLPPSPIGVASLGATMTFPPHPPHRPQPLARTVTFDGGCDVAEIEMTLSPCGPLDNLVSTFAATRLSLAPNLMRVGEASPVATLALAATRPTVARPSSTRWATCRP